MIMKVGIISKFNNKIFIMIKIKELLLQQKKEFNNIGN